MAITVKEILHFLRIRHDFSEHHAQEAGARKDYGTALYSEGLASAYAFTILHIEQALGVESSLKPKSKKARRKHSRDGVLRCPICSPLRCSKAA